MTLSLFAEATSAPGLFVTIDGPNASGKTSLAAAVAELLAEEHDVYATRQPSRSELGALARRSEATVRGRALACLVAADRHDQLAREIVPALARGSIVVCDRYVESSLVLQRLDDVDLEFIIGANGGIRRPDVRVRLQASEAILSKRLAARPRGPERRFEGMLGAPTRELALYTEADALLAERYQLPATLLDTTHSTAAEQALRVVAVVRSRLEERQ